MDKKLYVLIGILLGTVSGAAGTYFFVKKKYEKIAQEEIDSVKESYKNRPMGNVTNAMMDFSKTASKASEKISSTFSMKKAEIEDELDKIKKNLHKPSPEELISAKPFAGSEEVTNVFASYEDYYKDEHDEEEAEEEEIEEPKIAMPKGVEPCIISEADFQIDDEHEKIALLYMKDGSIIGEDGSHYEKEELNEMLGDKCLKTITASVHDDDQSVYIRNEERNCDYELIFVQY